MLENELIILSFCELLQSEEKGMYIEPLLDCEFTKDTKGIVLVRGNEIYEENSVVNIKVNDEIIWTSNMRIAPSNINYINEESYLDLYISEKAFLQHNVTNGVNTYFVELITNGIVVGQANFQASVKVDDDYVEDCHKVNLNAYEHEEDSYDPEENIDNDSCKNMHADIEGLNVKSIITKDSEASQSYKETPLFTSHQNLSLDQLIEYKEIIKQELDNLIEKTKIIHNENYFDIIASTDLMNAIKEIGESKKEIEDKIGSVLSFYSKSYDFIQESIENEKINIAKRLLDNGLDEKTISDIMNLNINKFI